MAASDDKPRKADKAEKAKDLPKARVVERESEGPARVQDPLRMIRIGGFLLALIGGWVFILAQNRFDPTPPVVFVCLGYLALLSAIYALWRTGVVVADENEDYMDSTVERPVGALGELEREKKSLLKAIKETEFDREMGKLSKADADQMIKVYRARAIEVIKELELVANPSAEGAGTVREQIAREVKARLELAEKTKQAEIEAKAAKKKQKAKPATKEADKEVEAAEKLLTEAVAAAAKAGIFQGAADKAPAPAPVEETREASTESTSAGETLAAQESEASTAKSEGATS